MSVLYFAANFTKIKVTKFGSVLYKLKRDVDPFLNMKRRYGPNIFLKVKLEKRRFEL